MTALRFICELLWLHSRS